MTTLKEYLKVRAHLDRLNKEIGDAISNISAKEKEIECLKELLSDLKYEIREVADQMRKMEKETLEEVE